MLRTLRAAGLLAFFIGPVSAATAGDIDTLKGQFTFNWHDRPEAQTCKTVDDKLLSALKSDAFKCDLNAVTNTASANPARVCSEGDEGAEYLVFETRKACEEEREAQAANSEE